MEKMILIDLETQNFPVESGIYEVACLVVENYKIVDRLYLGEKIEGYNGKTTYGHGFHNISQDIQYIDKFKKFLSKYNYPLVAHNCSFDRKFLVYYNWINENYPCYCSIQAIKKEVTDLKSYSMENLIKHFDINNKINHTAMSDTENLYELLNIIKPTIWKKMGKSKVKNKNNDYSYEVDIKNSLNNKVLENKIEISDVNEQDISYIFNEKTIKYNRMNELLDIDKKNELTEEQKKEYDFLKDELLGGTLPSKKWFVYLMLFLFFPYGLWLMWRHNEISLKTKSIITLVIIFIGIIGNKN